MLRVAQHALVLGSSGHVQPNLPKSAQPTHSTIQSDSSSGFDKDISPTTISSWIKQTVILCYELSDQEALALLQIKADDVRAFAASKAFRLGLCLEQILSACHRKSHNTFTQFHLKDVSWADSELFDLGPVVAAQQIHK